MISIRQSAAMILAYVIRDLVPDTLFIGGGHSDIGFYYDFVLKHPLREEIIPVIEEKMRISMKQGLILKPLEMMQGNAAEMFNYHKQPLQAKRALNEEGNILSIVQIGTFYDICPPPFVESGKEIGVIKILSIEMLPGEITRITGTAFPDPGSLKNFLKKYEIAKKIDHSKYFSESMWFPKGAMIREKLINWWKLEHAKENFSLVKAESHAAVFAHFFHSYKDLAVKYAEFSDTRGDVATIFCRPEELQQEVNYSLQFIQKLINILGIGHQWFLVTQEKKDKTTELLVQELERNGIHYTLDVQKTKAPRIEVRWVDMLERQWQGPTLLIDRESPKTYALRYQGEDNHMHQPMMITFGIFGSLERALALMIEECKGQLPSWLHGNNGDQKTFESK